MDAIPRAEIRHSMSIRAALDCLAIMGVFVIQTPRILHGSPLMSSTDIGLEQEEVFLFKSRERVCLPFQIHLLLDINPSGLAEYTWLPFTS